MYRLPDRNRLEQLWLLPLTLTVLLVHGYHPWAEDGGLYVAGIEHLLDPTLFPAQTGFVTEHLRYSVFAPLLAACVRTSHLSLAAVLFATYLLSSALMLFAGVRLASFCLMTRTAQWMAVTLLAAWWTLPVAGTSLLLMDPYVTARSLSLPLTLLAVSATLSQWSPVSAASSGRRQAGRSPAALCGVALLAAAAFHPLMAGYGVGFVILIRMEQRRKPWPAFCLLTVIVLSLAAVVQGFAKPETPSAAAAIYSRYYWFPSQWHWYELCGLLGPVMILAALLRWPPTGFTEIAKMLSRAALRFAALSLLTAALFSHEHFQSHLVASMQPLRAFCLIYVVMIVLLGGACVSLARELASRTQSQCALAIQRTGPGLFLGLMAFTMFLVQRASFPNSPQVELPGRDNPNGWVEAFLWARAHTPKSALFALDARYVNTEGEDAQTFRAIAERSAIPDYSKDGGEAAISPALAPEWQRAASATVDLSELTDKQRDALLLPFGVLWVVLHRSAITHHACPYRNATVQLCILR